MNSGWVAVTQPTHSTKARIRRILCLEMAVTTMVVVWVVAVEVTAVKVATNKVTG